MKLFDIPEGIQPVVFFSGGRTSGLMARLLMDKYPDYSTRFITVFCNTGKEKSQTLDFVHDVETKWEIPIVWLEYTRVPATIIPAGIFPTPRRNQLLAKSAAAGETVHWFKQVDYATANREGKPFDELLEVMSVLPNVTSRNCSAQLKIRTGMRYLFSIGVKEYASVIGIRKDEENRATQILAQCDSFDHPQFPLCDWGIDVQRVNDFWKHNDFDLQLESYEGNCDLCFLKAKWKRIKIIREHPETVGWWKGWEAKKAAIPDINNGKFFRLGESYAELEQLALAPQQPEFCWTTDTDIPCSCAERGFEPSEDV